MASKGGKVTEREILRMLELFVQGYSFKAIGKKLRRDPATVSRYVKLRTSMKEVQTFYENKQDKKFIVHRNMISPEPQDNYMIMEDEHGIPVLVKITKERLR